MTVVFGYIFFFYLVWLGYEALKPRICDPRKIFIVPLIFIFLSIWSLVSGFQGILDLFVWAVSLLIGYAIGFRVTQPMKVRADRQKMYMGLPGNPMILILVLIFFGAKFFFGYFPDFNPRLLAAFVLILTSAITGIIIGNTLSITKKFSKAKHEKLRKK